MFNTNNLFYINHNIFYHYYLILHSFLYILNNLNIFYFIPTYILFCCIHLYIDFLYHLICLINNYNHYINSNSKHQLYIYLHYYQLYKNCNLFNINLLYSNFQRSFNYQILMNWVLHMIIIKYIFSFTKIHNILFFVDIMTHIV